MESKNPLEEIREAILASQLFGIENEITQMGVSNELLKISDALDKYYGIKRESKLPPSNEKHKINDNDVYILKPSPYISNNVGNSFGGERFVETKDLIKSAKEPLQSIRRKLSKEDPLYLNLSSAIVSIAVRNVVSTVNSYQKPSYNGLGGNSYYDYYKRFDPISGIDIEFRNLVFGGLTVFNELMSFDMTNECMENYEANDKTIRSMAKSIHDKMLHPRSRSSSQSSSSGCMVLAFAVSTSILVCLGTIILVIV